MRSLSGLILTLSALVTFARGNAQNVPGTSFGYVDPLKKVLETDALRTFDQPIVYGIRGQATNLQFVFKSKSTAQHLRVEKVDLTMGGVSLKNIEVRYVGYVTGKFGDKPAGDRISPDNLRFPDPLLDVSEIEVGANTCQPIWITVNAPDDAAPGTYQGSITIDATVGGAPVRISQTFQVKIYPIALGPQTLWVANQEYVDNPRVGGTMGTFSFMNDGAAVEPYSEHYWSLVETMAHLMRKYHQNVVLAYPQHMIDYGYANGKWTFDFSKFDRFIKIFKDAGVIGRIEGGYLSGRNGGWTAKYVLIYYVFDAAKGKVVSKTGDLDNPDLKSYFVQYIPALVAHLKSMNLYDSYIQHIGDEPIPDNTDSWIAIRNYIAGLAPDMKFMDALQTADARENLNVWVPILNVLAGNYPFFKGLQSQGKEVWFYTAFTPQGEFANRLVELPLIKTRLLHWINFKYGITGYLCWGFNHWAGSDPMHNAAQGGLPGGDAWIIYPKKDGFLSSIRLEAMRDGIVDYELLTMLAHRNKSKADGIAAKIVKDWNSYDTDISSFNQVRKELLDDLSN